MRSPGLDMKSLCLIIFAITACQTAALRNSIEFDLQRYKHRNDVLQEILNDEGCEHVMIKTQAQRGATLVKVQLEVEKSVFDELTAKLVKCRLSQNETSSSLPTTDPATTPPARRLNYLGCFKDTGDDRDLTHLTNVGAGNSIPSCIDHCYALGFKYAGLQYTTWCICGNSYGKHGVVADSECNMPCPGSPGHCGAGVRNSIFEAAAPAGRYLGCYIDRASARDLPYLVNFGNKNSISACLNTCSITGYRYAGLQASTWCTCGNTYGSHGEVSQSECNSRCPAAPGAKCGAGARNSIYEVST